MGFKPNSFDPDVWIMGSEGVYEYTRTHTDDFLGLSFTPNSIFNKLKLTYTIKAFGPPKVHIGCDYEQINKGATTKWVMGSSTYIAECLKKIYAILKVTNLRKYKLPCSPGDHPKLDSSPLLCEAQHCLYQQLVSMAEWAIQIGRLTSCNRFLAGPERGPSQSVGEDISLFAKCYWKT